MLSVFFTAELQSLTIHCEFGDCLDEILRGCFVCELASEAIQKWFLTEKELMFSRAINIADDLSLIAHRVLLTFLPSLCCLVDGFPCLHIFFKCPCYHCCGILFQRTLLNLYFLILSCNYQTHIALLFRRVNLRNAS